MMTYDGLNYWMNAIIALPHWVGLMISDTYPSLETKLGDISIQEGLGLEEQQIQWATPRVSDLGVVTPSIPLVFSLASAQSSPIVVYGYAVLTTGGTSGPEILVFAKRWAQAQSVQLQGDSLTVLVELKQFADL